jgi:hypothetical protein
MKMKMKRKRYKWRRRMPRQPLIKPIISYGGTPN